MDSGTRRASALLAALLGAVTLVGAGPARAADPPWSSKLDPLLRRVALGTSVVREGRRVVLAAGSPEVLDSLPRFVRRTRDATGARLGVLARTDRAGEDLRQLLIEAGAEVRGVVGATLSLRVAPKDLETVARLPAVLRLEAAGTYELTAEISTGADHVASREANLLGAQGAGVIVAVFDTGIDWTNDDFRNPDGTTRILGIWDQTAEEAAFPPPPGFDFGSYYDRADIDAALAGTGLVATQDVHGHGTHVAGTAAGNGRRTGNGVPPGTFAGVAPLADLVTIKVFEGPGADFCDQCDLVAGVQFVRELAASLGRPWVGNMSLGSNLGPHDGTTGSELAIDAAVGPGTRGRQMAIAAGNSGTASRHSHWRGALAAGQALSNTFELGGAAPRPGSENDEIWLDLWYQGEDRLTFEIETPSGEVIAAAHGQDSGIVCSPSGAVQIDATNGPDPDNGDNQVFVQIWDSAACLPLVIEPQSGTWRLRLVPDVVTSQSRKFHLWNAASARGQTWVDLQEFDEGMSVLQPGTSRHGLTVGSYVSKDQWVDPGGNLTAPCCDTAVVGSRSRFSGEGPTRDGRLKPDVSAPGEWVGSSISAADLTQPSTAFRERDGEHANARGTSMAAPHVAGTVALLLGMNPDLDGAALAAAVTRSARNDVFAPAANTSYGFGKLYAARALYEAASMVTDVVAGSTGALGGSDNALIASYNVYRGVPGDLLQKSYGQCLFHGLAEPAWDDPDTPPAGGYFFYVVSGVYVDPETGAEVEGLLGTDSKGSVRGNSFPCP